MDIALWTIQGILGAAFLAHGFMLAFVPMSWLGEKIPMFRDMQPRTVRAIGGLEIAGAVGVVLPWLTGTADWLTPVAALGLALTMVGAALTHYRRKEFDRIPPNGVLLGLAVFAAIGRFAEL